MTRLLLAAVAVCAFLAATADAAPSQEFVYDRQLGVAARQSLWVAITNPGTLTRRRVFKVYVRCYRTREAFERRFEQRYGVPARRVVAYYGGGGNVHLRGGTCDNVRLFLGGRHTVFTAAAFAVLLHESLHRQGVRNERVTTCFANEAVRWGALWHGFTDEQALRARNLAFTYSRLHLPDEYFIGKPTCLKLTRNRDWPAFRERGRR